MMSARTMKSSAQKSTLSLVPNDRFDESAPDVKSESRLRESFDGWLNAVAPTLLPSALHEDRPNPNRGSRSLTLADMTRLNRATVRESTDHRQWPPEVVTSFLAADVIKRKQG